MPRLKGKVAVITGGSSGQGLATAKRFVEEGAVVYTLDKAASPIGRSVAAVQGDVSNLADLDRLYAKIASEKGRIDVIFAAAGIVEPQPLAQMTEESFDRQFAVNTRGLAFTVSKALPLLNDGASIILVTSIADRKGIAGLGVYSATKAAVGSFVRSWTAELKDRGIRVNAICPGIVVDTAMRTAIEAQQRHYGLPETADREQSIPIGRVSVPNDVARIAAFLASDEASYVTGESINLSGGLLMD